MNALFPRVAQDELRVVLTRHGATIKQLQFTGNRAAFMRADFSDFYSLLTPFNVLWLTRNVLVFEMSGWPGINEDSIIDLIAEASSLGRQRRDYSFRFDLEGFEVLCINEPNEEDEGVFDMLLESLGRRNITTIEICAYEEPPVPLIFTTEALRQFLVGNEQLTKFMLHAFTISADACDIIGRITHLETLSLSCCELDVQRLVGFIGGSTGGPSVFILDSCTADNVWGEPEMNFGSIFITLLKNHTIKKLELSFADDGSRSSNFSAIKAALENHQGLESLEITNCHSGIGRNELMLLFQGIAAASKLRTLKLDFSDDDAPAVSPQEQIELFAKALLECKNNTLEEVDCVLNSALHGDTWKYTVVPILDFNRERRLFLEDVARNSRTRPDLFERALVYAEENDNNHLRFWLVHRYSNALRQTSWK